MARYFNRTVTHMLFEEDYSILPPPFNVMVEFVHRVLVDRGIDIRKAISENVCPFCGKRVPSLRKHLTMTKSRCNREFRNIVDEILVLYREVRVHVHYKNHDKIWCKICGYHDEYIDVLYHVYKKHYNGGEHS